jgi:drug/metabolite transporter (DMT)-like permease
VALYGVNRHFSSGGAGGASDDGKGAVSDSGDGGAPGDGGTAPGGAPRPHPVRSTFILTCTAFIWGMAFVAQRVGMEFVGPFFFTGIRMLLGALTLLAVLGLIGLFGGGAGVARKRNKVARERVSARWRALIKAGVACGVVIFLAGCAQQVGLVFTTASKAGFLTALYIVLVPLLGIALRHKTHWNTWVSVAVAAVGLYFLCVTGGFTLQLGDAIVLIGAVFWAGHILVIDHFVGGLGKRDVMRLCVVQFAVASLLAFCSSLLFDGLFATGAFSVDGLAAALPAILYTGILSTGVAFTFQAMGQQGLSPSAASIVMSLEAVFSVLGGMLLLGETLTAREAFGCAALFAAVILSQLPAGQAKRAP